MLWRDGQIIEGDVAPFDFRDRGLLLGDGAFDTALAIGGRIVFEEAHLARLVASLALLGIPMGKERIREAMRAVAAAAPLAAVRTTITRGAGPRGIAPPVKAEPFVFASGAPVAAGLAFAPVTLHRTEIRRNDSSPLSRIKTLGYLDSVLAAREAAAEGHADALFLNTAECVACTGTANIFAVLGDRLVTPSISEGVLPGTIRSAILRLAGDLGLSAEERPLLPEELARAEAVFATNALRLLAPVTAIGATHYASAQHPIVARLREALSRAVCESCDAPLDVLT